ncbi:MAG: methionyl-tRNA formyltransferase [Bacteroidales bacterium]|nr:methionyl-tRNA formyltransferase [Bacteroidales bacterium]
MNPKECRIVYMGTPEFAVAPLQALVENGYNVVGVITMPDKPAGRGHKIQFSPVKQYALEKGLSLLQPEKLKDETFLGDLRAWKADMQIVVAFRMLPEVVWNMPPMGTFNLHASLLPQYRGAAPINWAVMNGEVETGVTTFRLTHEIDTGKILFQEKTPIGENENVGEIYERLMQIGAPLVLKTVDAIVNGTVDGIAQERLVEDEDDLMTAPKIFKDTCRINWAGDVEALHNFVRGLSPYPAAWSELVSPEGEHTGVKIFETAKQLENHMLSYGSIVTDGKNNLKVAVCDGYLQIKSLQLAGKRRMTPTELLCGLKLDEKWHFD